MDKGKSEKEDLAIKAIEIINSESHLSGLTDKIMRLLEEKVI